MIREKAKVLSPGQMGVNTSVNGKVASNMVSAPT